MDEPFINNTATSYTDLDLIPQSFEELYDEIKCLDLKYKLEELYSVGVTPYEKDEETDDSAELPDTVAVKMNAPGDTNKDKNALLMEYLLNIYYKGVYYTHLPNGVAEQLHEFETPIESSIISSSKTLLPEVKPNGLPKLPPLAEVKRLLLPTKGGTTIINNATIANIPAIEIYPRKSGQKLTAFDNKAFATTQTPKIYGMQIPNNNELTMLVQMFKFMKEQRRINLIIDLHACGTGLHPRAEFMAKNNYEQCSISSTVLPIDCEKQVANLLGMQFEYAGIEDMTCGHSYVWLKLMGFTNLYREATPVIHCQAGYGRTGSVILLYKMYAEASLNLTDKFFGQSNSLLAFEHLRDIFGADGANMKKEVFNIRDAFHWTLFLNRINRIKMAIAFYKAFKNGGTRPHVFLYNATFHNFRRNTSSSIFNHGRLVDVPIDAAKITGTRGFDLKTLDVRNEYVNEARIASQYMEDIFLSINRNEEPRHRPLTGDVVNPIEETKQPVDTQAPAPEVLNNEQLLKKLEQQVEKNQQCLLQLQLLQERNSENKIAIQNLQLQQAYEKKTIIDWLNNEKAKPITKIHAFTKDTVYPFFTSVPTVPGGITFVNIYENVTPNANYSYPPALMHGEGKPGSPYYYLIRIVNVAFIPYPFIYINNDNTKQLIPHEGLKRIGDATVPYLLLVDHTETTNQRMYSLRIDTTRDKVGILDDLSDEPLKTAIINQQMNQMSEFKTRMPNFSLKPPSGGATTIKSSKRKVRYASRECVVHKQERRQYIIMKGNKVWLKDIRGKYEKVA